MPHTPDIQLVTVSISRCEHGWGFASVTESGYVVLHGLSDSDLLANIKLAINDCEVRYHVDAANGAAYCKQNGNA